MTCADDLTLSIDADGELPLAKAEELRSHLAGCPSCRARSAALKTESASLTAALREVPLLVPAPDAPGTVWAWAGIAAAGFIGTVAAVDALRHAPSLPKWLGIDALDPVLALGFPLFEAGLRRLQEGVPPMPSMLSILTMILLIVVAFRLRRTRAAAMVLFVLLAPAASATETRFPPRGSSSVLIGAGETIDDTLLVGGESIVVQGAVNGDLILMGREARVEGTVAGSVFCMARRLEVSGHVRDDVYTMNETLSIRGRVSRSVHAMTQDTAVDGAATVERDLFALANKVSVAGNLGRRLSVSVQSAELAGIIGGSARVNAHHLHVFDSARIAGDLIASLPRRDDAGIASGARIEGAKRITVTPESASSRNKLHRFLEPGFYLWQALWLGAALLCGGLLRWLAPAVFEPRPIAALRILQTAGIGLVALVVTPVAAILAGITVVGLPAALIALGGWAAALYLAGVFASAWLGRIVLRREPADLRTFLLVLLVGQLILRIVKPLPWIGSLTCFVALLLGLGLAVAASRAVYVQLRTR